MFHFYLCIFTPQPLKWWSELLSPVYFHKGVMSVMDVSVTIGLHHLRRHVGLPHFFLLFPHPVAHVRY